MANLLGNFQNLIIKIVYLYYEKYNIRIIENQILYIV